jgi:hypothetical protein
MFGDGAERSDSPPRRDPGRNYDRSRRVETLKVLYFSKFDLSFIFKIGDVNVGSLCISPLENRNASVVFA